VVLRGLSELEYLANAGKAHAWLNTFKKQAHTSRARSKAKQ
jgi:hypothetical protein